MGEHRPTPPSMAAYLAGLPPAARQRLEEIRAIIRGVAPAATEAISYGIPAFTVEGSPFIYFAGFDKHVSVYPVPLGDPALAADLAPYGSGKATARFPLDAPIPAELVARIARLKLEQHTARLLARRAKRTRKRKDEP